MVSSRRREETRRVFGRRRDDKDVGGGKHVSVCVCVCVVVSASSFEAFTTRFGETKEESLSSFSDTLN